MSKQNTIRGCLQPWICKLTMHLPFLHSTWKMHKPFASHHLQWHNPKSTSKITITVHTLSLGMCATPTSLRPCTCATTPCQPTTPAHRAILASSTWTTMCSFTSSPHPNSPLRFSHRTSLPPWRALSHLRPPPWDVRHCIGIGKLSWWIVFVSVVFVSVQANSFVESPPHEGGAHELPRDIDMLLQFAIVWEDDDRKDNTR
jgi:hypothetical protein